MRRLALCGLAAGFVLILAIAHKALACDEKVVQQNVTTQSVVTDPCTGLAVAQGVGVQTGVVRSKSVTRTGVGPLVAARQARAARRSARVSTQCVSTQNVLVQKTVPVIVQQVVPVQVQQVQTLAVCPQAVNTAGVSRTRTRTRTRGVASGGTTQLVLVDPNQQTQTQQGPSEFNAQSVGPGGAHYSSETQGYESHKENYNGTNPPAGPRAQLPPAPNGG